jgi:hypothetical protein
VEVGGKFANFTPFKNTFTNRPNLWLSSLQNAYHRELVWYYYLKFGSRQMPGSHLAPMTVSLVPFLRTKKEILTVQPAKCQAKFPA